MSDIYEEIKAERDRQDIQWGGPENDDAQKPGDWRTYRCKFEERVLAMLDSPHEGVYELADGRRALIQIAALAVAQIEALDRKSDA